MCCTWNENISSDNCPTHHLFISLCFLASLTPKSSPARVGPHLLCVFPLSATPWYYFLYLPSESICRHELKEYFSCVDVSEEEDFFVNSPQVSNQAAATNSQSILVVTSFICSTGLFHLCQVMSPKLRAPASFSFFQKLDLPLSSCHHNWDTYCCLK